MDENDDEEEIMRSETFGGISVEPPDLPHSYNELKTPYTSVQDWLSGICKEQEPQKSMLEYHIGLFGHPTLILGLTGHNNYLGNGTQILRTDFRPVHQFFPLPKEEYGYLSSEQLKRRILKQLKAFVKTAEFRQSYLAKADWITTNLGDFDEDIWPVYEE